MGNDYLWHSYKIPAVAGRSHNPAPQVKLEAPPAINSSVLPSPVAEIANRFRNSFQAMEIVREEPQQIAMPAVDPSVPDARAKWNALVDVASFLFERLVEAERAEAERSMINAGELPVAQNVTIDGQDQQQEEQNGEDDFFDNDYSEDYDDDEDDDTLIIDEGPSEPKQQSEVARHNAQRASVIIALPPKAEPSTAGSGSSIQSDPEPMPSTSSGSSGSSGSTRSRDDSCSVSDSSASGPYPKRRRPAAIRRPKHMSQLTLDPSVPFQVEVRYQKNMARNFPGTENRTPEQQALRARNTLAARQSRAKLRVMDDILQQEAFNEKALNEFVKERLSASFTYANTLRELQGLELMDFMMAFEEIKEQYVVEPLRAQHFIPRGMGPPLREAEVNVNAMDFGPRFRRSRANYPRANLVDDGFADDYVGEQEEEQEEEVQQPEQDAQAAQPMPWRNFAMGVYPNFDFGERNF